jgi:HK97 family phage major capsid protein
VSWSWDPEATEVSDDAPTFAGPEIPVHKAAGFVPFLIEVGMDGANITAEVGRLLARGKDDLEAVAFATGSGTNEPTGFITALIGAAPPVVAATTNDTFGAVDIYKLDQALPGRYRQRASWIANRAIWNTVDQFETSNGSKQFPGVHGQPGDLLSRPTYEAEAMDGSIATSNDYVLCYGDFSNFVLADRIGLNVELVSHLFSTTSNRPSGQRGLYAWYRTGSDSVNDGGLKVLRI